MFKKIKKYKRNKVNNQEISFDAEYNLHEKLRRVGECENQIASYLNQRKNKKYRIPRNLIGIDEKIKLIRKESRQIYSELISHFSKELFLLEKHLNETRRGEIYANNKTSFEAELKPEEKRIEPLKEKINLYKEKNRNNFFELSKMLVSEDGRSEASCKRISKQSLVTICDSLKESSNVPTI